MNKKHFSTALLALAFVSLAAYAANSSHSKLSVWQVAADTMPIGYPTIKGSSAKLTRGDGMVGIKVNTTRLPAGAYTNWWVIFNNPDACGAPGCGGMDFPFNGGDPAVDASVMFATGGVVTDNGVGHFRAHLEENDLSGEVLFGPGLTTAAGAEIHYIVRYHGPAATGDLLIKQITTFGGGCMGLDADDPIFPCYDPQSTGFPKP